MNSLLNKAEQQEFVKQWTDKFEALAHMANTTREGVASIVAAVTQNFGAIQANLSMNSDAVEQLDIYNQIWAKLFVYIFEQLESLKPLSVNLESSKAEGRERFSAIFQECKDRVVEEREAYIKLRRQQVEEERKAQEQAKKQDTVAEETLRSAESAISMPGGEGSTIPEGAEIFGG